MPSVYLSKINSGKALPSFTIKGVSDQMPGIIADVPIIVHTPFYAIPKRLLPYIINAISTRTTVTTKDEIFFNAFKPIHTLTRLYEVPVATFRFKNLSTEDISELRGMGMQQDQTSKNIYVGTPAIHNLAKLNSLGPIEDRMRPGHINFDGYVAWVYLMKGIQIYTTMKNTVTKKGMNMLVDEKLSIPKGGSGGIATIDGERLDFANILGESVAAYSGTFVIAPPTVDVSAFSGSFRDVTNLGPVNEGIFYPYFSGMNTADKTTAYTVFQSIFQRTLSADEETDSRIMQKIRSGCRNISFSRTGIILAHIYKCIGIANEICGAKVHIVLKGNTYVGTIVEGTYSINMYAKVTHSGDDLAIEVGKTNLLDSQAQEICDKLNAVEDGNGAKVFNFERNDFLTSRRALRNFNSVDPALFHSSDTLDSVKGILERMEFNDTFPLPDQKLMLDAIRFMSTGDFAGISGVPAFLGGGVLNSRSRVYEALSMFGPRAPTCNYGDNKGTMITFPASGKEDKNLVRENGVRPLAYFPFQVVPIGTAAVHWDQMISRGFMSVPKGRKGKKEFTDLHRVVFSVSSDPAFSEMYGLIKGMADDARKSGDAAGKRKRDTGDDGNSGGKRPKGADKLSADF